MKNILLATTALVLSAGVAAAEVTLSGDARMGIVNNNFVDTNDVTLDDNGHGTQVAGVLGANPDNGVLGAGVDWRFAQRWSAGLRYTRNPEETFGYLPTTTARSGLYQLVATDDATEAVTRKVGGDSLSLSINYRF